MRSAYLWTIAATITSIVAPLLTFTTSITIIDNRLTMATTTSHAAPSTQPTSRPTTQQHNVPATQPALRLLPQRNYTLAYKQFYRVQQTAFGKDTKVRRQHNITFIIQRHKLDNKGTITLKMTFKRLHLTVQAGLLKMAYDSLQKVPKIPAQAHVLAAFVGHHMFVKLQANGQVTHVTFSPALRKALKAAIASHPILAMLSGAQHTTMIRRANRQYGPTQWRREMSMLWSYLPIQGTKQQQATSPLYGLTQRTTWQLTKASKQHRSIRRKGTLNHTKDGVTPFDVGSTKNMVYNIKGTTKGTLTIDTATQLPRAGRMFTELVGKIAWHPKNHSKARRTWPVLIQHITQFKLTP